MKKRRLTIRVGPLGLSLAAAALTAVALAAVSVADNGGGNDSGTGKGGEDAQMFRAPAPPGGGAGVFFHDRLSEADRQKMEEFRQCMEDNGAPGPPEPGEFDPSNPPKPPSEADQRKLKSAWEACRDKLPEELQNADPPQVHVAPCGPHPGAPGTEERGNREKQSDASGGSSSGSTT
jgi:hypothetical protein